MVSSARLGWRGVGAVTSPAADRVYVGSSPTPSSNDVRSACIKRIIVRSLRIIRTSNSDLERLMEELKEGLGIADAASIAEDECISVDVEIFGIVGSLREAEYLMASGIPEAASAAIRESMTFLIGECERRGCSEELIVRLKRIVKELSNAVASSFKIDRLKLI